jgi:SAM-dependent methyltransferase
VTVQSNWWGTFFEGAAVDLWLQALPPEHTEREADRLARTLDVQPGARLLDVPCGAGRLSLALADRGFALTGVDWSPEFLQHAKSRDVLGRVRWERRDMRDLPWRARFEARSASATARRQRFRVISFQSRIPSIVGVRPQPAEHSDSVSEKETNVWSSGGSHPCPARKLPH